MQTIDPTLVAAITVTVIFLGAINWLATVVIVSNKAFEDVREVFEKVGDRLTYKHPRIGPKVVFFCKCFMCVGVWIGFAEHAAFGGPLHPNPSWATFIANGLLYKAVGHLILQHSEHIHSKIEFNNSRTKLGKQTYKLRKTLFGPLLEDEHHVQADQPTSHFNGNGHKVGSTTLDVHG